MGDHDRDRSIPAEETVSILSETSLQKIGIVGTGRARGQYHLPRENVKGKRHSTKENKPC